MVKKKASRGFLNFGFSTILLAFVMICVVTFSALALVTANSDYRLSQKVAEKTKAYYAAEENAYIKLLYIDQILADCYLASGDETAYYTNVSHLVAEYGTFEEASGEYQLSFTETIADNQYLSVTLSIQYPTDSPDTFYEIEEWKTVYENTIPEDDYLDLIQ